MTISNHALEYLIAPLGLALSAALNGDDVYLYFQGPAVKILTKGFSESLSGVGKPFTILDLLLSFAVDTTFLPFMVFLQLIDGYIVDPPYFKIGRYLAHCNDLTGAIKHYQKGLEVLPKYYDYKDGDPLPYPFEDVLSSIESLYEKKGDYLSAITYSSRHNE